MHYICDYFIEALGSTYLVKVYFDYSEYEVYAVLDLEENTKIWGVGKTKIKAINDLRPHLISFLKGEG